MARRGHEAETVITFRDGDYVVRAGDEGGEMYIVQSGAVEVVRPGTPPIRLAQGEFFGEMSLLESLPRDADVRAVGETRVVVVSQGDLLMRIRRDPTFALEMLHKMSGRLRAANAEAQRRGDP